ncbi:hypothetical protein LX87_05252 [Larkinella arboricola]|uniref:Uncharacterized protein n=1 Tax=Larkinella arboricola TaxID=643671 RepID=A0A327WKI8_LARAB|nr:hypothetical protein [Larkinella arboricola]RAJ92283.1 hypothetical protein LX87_05252 [Larkinella arboricola]
MKTSNKLLIALFLAGFLTLIGTNMALRAEYDKIDFNNPFHGLSSLPVKPFRVLKLEGGKTGIGLLNVQTGKQYGIHLPEKNKEDFKFQSKGDTLIVRYQPPDAWQSSYRYKFDANPVAIIMTPTLDALHTTRISCILKEVRTDKLTVVQERAGVMLTNSTIGTLTVTDTQGSDLHAKPTNRIGTALITSRDSSNLLVEHDVFGTLTLETDSLATVKVPGGLLKKLKL